MTENINNRASQAEDPDASKPVMLLVEDQQDVRTVFSLVLSAQGFQVSEAATLEAGIKFCKQQLPDVALIDADLDGSDGMTLGTFIRGLSGGNKVVLGALTGNEGVSCRKKAVQCGFDFHFIKPVKIKEVSEVIHQRLSGNPSQPHCRWSLENL